MYNWLGITDNDWNWLAVLIKDTDILAPAEYKHKFGAMRRIVQDKQLMDSKGIYGKYEIFDEFLVGKIKLN